MKALLDLIGKQFGMFAEIRGSKKNSQAWLGAVVVIGLAFYFPEGALKATVLYLVAGLFAVAILAQGIADLGKERAKIEAGK